MHQRLGRLGGTGVIVGLAVLMTPPFLAGAENQAKIYHNPQFNITIQAPLNWHIIDADPSEDTPLAKTLAYFSEQDSRKALKQRPYIELLVYHGAVPQNWQEYLPTHLATMQQYGFAQAGPIEQVWIGGEDGRRFIHERRSSEGVEGVLIEYVVLKHGHAFYLWLPVAAKHRETLEQYIGLFDTCAKTMQID